MPGSESANTIRIAATQSIRTGLNPPTDETMLLVPALSRASPATGCQRSYHQATARKVSPAVSATFR